jgi:hypothetical protein
LNPPINDGASNNTDHSGTRALRRPGLLRPKVRLEEEDNKIWKVVAWELRDLSTLKTRPNTEFNAGLSDLANAGLLGSSDVATRSLVISGQSAPYEPRPVAARGNMRRRRMNDIRNLG